MGDAERFLCDHFTLGPHTFQGAGFDDLLSLADVDRSLTGGGLRRPAARLVHDGEPVDPARWTRRARTGSTWIDDLIDPGRLLEHFADGATVVLQSLQRWWPPVSGFCRALEEALGHPVQANAYLTPPGAAGLAPHHDTHDVFVLQLHGTKHWVVRAPVVDAPLPRHRSSHGRAGDQPVVLETALQPGDCLYLPRGFVHSARAQEATSLHLTIGVLATTVHDLVRRIVDATAEEPGFRRNLPTSFAASSEVAAATVQEVVGELISWLGRLDVDAVAEAARLRSPTAQRPPPLDGHLLDLAALGAIDDATRVRRRPRTCHVAVVGDRAHVTAGDRRLDLPAALAGVLRRLLDGATVDVGALGDVLDGPSRLVLVRRLVRDGLLRIVDDGRR